MTSINKTITMKLNHQFYIVKLPTRRAGVFVVKFKYNDIITLNVTIVNIKFDIFATLLIMYKNIVTFLWEVNMSKLTDFIDLELKRRRIQKKDLLEYVGVSRVAYSRWARGEAHPKLANMTLISEFLSIPLKDLISLTGREYLSNQKQKKPPPRRMTARKNLNLIFQRFSRWK